MKMVRCLIIVSMCVFCFLQKPIFAKRIDRVLLTPGSATLWVTETLPVKNGSIQFTLPPQADPRSLRILPKTAGLKFFGISYELIEERKEKELADLKAQIDRLEEEIERMNAKIDALDKTTKAWMAQSKQKFEKSDEATKFVSTLEKALLDLYEKRASLDGELKKKRKELKKLKKKYNDLAGASQKAWRLSCDLAEGTSKPTVELSYSFLMKDAGWKPNYFLDAYPKSGEIRFSLQAGVWQRSGFDWKNVDVFLATSEIPMSILPPELPPWTIRVYEPPRVKRSMESRMAMAPMYFEGKPEQKKPGITAEMKSTYRIYHIGRLDIPAGKTTNVLVENEKWKAKFRYLLRPYVSPWAYVQGKVEFDEEMAFPTARASIFLEGTYIGEQNLNIFGKDKVFSLGPDKLVKAKLVLEKRQTGKTGFFKGKKTFLWKWHFSISNHHDFDVFVRLEERKPRASDERIEFKEMSVPDLPLSKDSKPDRWTWEFKLKPKEKRKFSFLVKVLVPESMEVDPGW